MVKISLQIRAALENVAEIYTDHPDHTFLLKVKCLNCGEVSQKWQDVRESQTYETKTGKSHETNYFAKCKLCSRENSLDIIEGTNGKYTSEDIGKYKNLVTFDCRGIEPVEYIPSEGWIAKTESGKLFESVDLSEKEWVEYDDKANEPVGISEFEYQFVKVK